MASPFYRSFCTDVQRGLWIRRDLCSAMAVKSADFVGPVMRFRHALCCIIIAIIVVVLWIPYLYPQAAQTLRESPILVSGLFNAGRSVWHPTAAEVCRLPTVIASRNSEFLTRLTRQSVLIRWSMLWLAIPLDFLTRFCGDPLERFVGR
jgi:hypothetical protein